MVSKIKHYWLFNNKLFIWFVGILMLKVDTDLSPHGLSTVSSSPHLQQTPSYSRFAHPYYYFFFHLFSFFIISLLSFIPLVVLIFSCIWNHHLISLPPRLYYFDSPRYASVTRISVPFHVICKSWTVKNVEVRW